MTFYFIFTNMPNQKALMPSQFWLVSNSAARARVGDYIGYISHCYDKIHCVTIYFGSQFENKVKHRGGKFVVQELEPIIRKEKSEC